MIDVPNYYGFKFCTIVGHKYLLKLIALYNSLSATGRDFHIFILCMDDTIYYFLQKAGLSNATIIHLSQIENNELLWVKPSRMQNEYCWTLKAPFMLHILQYLGAKDIVYCDSDIYFFSDPQLIFDSLNQHSIYLCPQRDAEEIEQKYGKFQAGIVGFKNDYNGIEALKYWYSRCLAKCSANLEPDDDSFGDQKYLEGFPNMFGGVYIENNLGVDAAPWNCIYRNKDDFNVQYERPFLKDNVITAFHFATMDIFNEDEYDLWSYGRLDVPNNIISYLFLPYIEAVRNAVSFVRGIDPSILPLVFCHKNPNDAATYFQYNFEKKINFTFDDFYELCSIVSVEYITRAMALYSSLKKHNENFHIWLLAVEDSAYEALTSLNLKNATIVRLLNILTPEIEAISRERNIKEFCWTLKSFFIDYLFKNEKLNRVMYLDSDMYMFTKLKFIFKEWHTFSFVMCTQRADIDTESRCGFYQAGLLGIKNDMYGRNVLDWWKNRCFDWCYDYYDNSLNRWGDQKYLEAVPYDFENIKVINNFGINAAPWNMILNDWGYELYLDNNRVFINNAMLCAYHFGSIGINDFGSYQIWVHGVVEPRKELVELVYNPYFSQLEYNKGVLNGKASGWYSKEVSYDDMLLW